MGYIAEVLKVGSWAEVTVKPGMMPMLRKKLTLRDDEDNAFPQYRLHPKIPARIFVPRSLVSAADIPIEGEWPELGLKSKIKKYRDGQEEAINTFIGQIYNGNPYGGIMQAVTGAGKTVMALDMAVKLGLRTLVVVPRTSLVKQWVERIMEYTDAKADDIGVIQGTKCQYDRPIVVAMIHSLAQRYEKYPREMCHAFGTVIFDEVHVVGAETFSRTVPLFRCKYRIGLSATPRRSDGMDPVFWWHIGPIISKFTELQAHARVRIIRYRGSETNHRGNVWGGKLNLGRYLNRVTRSASRLQTLAKLVLTLDKKEHDILVLSDRIQHLRTLKAMLIDAGVDAGKIGFLIGQEKNLDRKIILGTYGSAGMGVDIPRLTALVLATPRADIEQAVGRVLRQGSPVIVDIVDTASTIMMGWFRKRMKYYRKITKDIQG